MSKSKYQYHTAHKQCGSSDGLAVYKDEKNTLTGYCWVCNTYVPAIQHRDVTGQQIQKDQTPLESTLEYPTGHELKERQIDGFTTTQFGVRVEYDEGFGTQKKYYYPVYKKGAITGWHVRVLPKDFYNIGDVKGSVDLFGQHLYNEGGKLLVITEGCDDAMAARMMLKEEKKTYRVVSLPMGANIRSIKDNLEWLSGFETIICAYDQDGPGRECAEKTAACFSPGVVRIATFGEKDCNDMLKAGQSRQFLHALYNAKEHTPNDIVSIADIKDKILEPIELGKDWPWESLSKATYGRRRREIYGFGAGTGSGKTEAFKEIIQHIIVNDNLPVGCIFLEEQPSLTAKAIAGKLCNKRFHIPGTDWTPEELEEAVDRLDGKVYFYDHWGTKDWESIKAKIRYLVVSKGIKDIFLDHLTAIVAGEPDVNRALERIMPEMASLTQELDFTLYYISHLTTPTQGRSHEEGGRVSVSQFRGSRTIGFWSHFLFGLERNQQAESEVERNSVCLRVLKDRYTGLGTGTTITLSYDREHGRFLESVSEF